MNRYILLPFLFLSFISFPLHLCSCISQCTLMCFPWVHVHLHQFLVHLFPFQSPPNPSTLDYAYMCFCIIREYNIFKSENVGKGDTFSKRSNPALFLFNKYKKNARPFMCIRQKWTDNSTSNRYVWIEHMFSLNEETYYWETAELSS